MAGFVRAELLTFQAGPCQTAMLSKLAVSSSTVLLGRCARHSAASSAQTRKNAAKLAKTQKQPFVLSSALS